MRRPSPDDAELKAAIRRYVVPETDGTARYLWLLGCDFATLGESARTAFLRQLAAAARQASDRELATLLDSEWRSRLTASWLIGLDRREQFRARWPSNPCPRADPQAHPSASLLTSGIATGIS